MKKVPLIENQSRRDFFIKMALTGLATTLPPMFLSSCEDEIKFIGTGKAPFKVWEEMLQAIKTSPDYLPQRAEDLIAAKDSEAMYNFVKNKITLMPLEANAVSYNNLGNGIKWGIDGVLRCGMATPREKAELLNLMYQKAGITSKIVYERTAITEEEVPSFFYRPIDRAFNPEISNKQFKLWEEAMGGSNEETEQKDVIIDYTKDANKLAETILETLPEKDSFGSKFNFKWNNYETPTVEFVQNNKTQYAHLFDPKTSFGEKHNSLNGQLTEAEAIQENTEKISLKITYRDTVNHKIVKDLIHGEWNALDLVGKQIQLSFLHGLSLEEQVVTPIGNLRTFTPALALQAIDEGLEYSQERSFIADPITIDGKRITLSEDKNYGPSGIEIAPKPHPELQNKVQNLDVTPKVSGYPIVKLSIDATDASGKSIEGLSATDFKISDNGKPIRALLENNRPTPKILVLYDNTGSMSYSYSGKGLANFNSNLKEKIKERYSDVIFDSRPVHSHKLYTGLLAASQTDFDLIVYIFDGGLDDKFENKNASVYSSGPPVLAVKAYNGYNDTSGLKTYTEIAKITNGKVIDTNDQEKVIEEIFRTIVEEIKIAPYVFTYASADKTKPHVVEVTLDNERLKAIENYTFPSLALEQINGISGIYLELKVGKNAPIKRVLAGWDPQLNYYDNPTNADRIAVKQVILGGLMLAVEGEGPTLAVALADLLKSKLSHRKWGEAHLDNDIKKAAEELSKGSIHIPSVLIPMLAPLQDQVTTTSITYPTGYRMCLLKNRIGLDAPSAFTFDYLSTSHYHTMAKDREERFVTTLKKTAQLAIREGTLFQQSTYTALRGVKYIDSNTANTEDWRYSVMDYNHKDFQYWNEKVLRGQHGTTTIFDITASSKSFWQLANNSGELYGIMPDSSGGGGDMFKKQLDELSLVVDAYMLVLGLVGAGNPSLSVVASLKKAEVRLWAIACESIIVMDTTGMDEAIIKVMQQLACNIFKDIALFGLGNYGTSIGGLELLIGLMGGKSPLSC